MRFSFADHVLDEDRRELWRGARQVHVEPQVFDLLIYLIRNRDRVVSKDDLIAAVWGGRIVSESTLASRISALRAAIGDSGRNQNLLRTVPRKGVRLVAAVTEEMTPNGRLSAAPGPELEPANVSATASSPTPGAAPRLSIVVLPFSNLSNDQEQEYFADGITDDLTTDLSRIPHLFVIARNTAFTYRNKPVSARQIGREVGVRYVLEGSVRKLNNQVRVNAQLIDAETDAHLWAERFDDNTSDVFALQNQITSRIAIALDTELVAAEAARPAVDPDALDYLLRGRSAFSKTPTLSSLAEAIDWIERAWALDPRSAETQSLLAFVYAFRALNQMSHTPAADIARAEGLVAEAFAATPGSPLVHLAKAQTFRAQGRFEEAISEYETVIACDRNAIRAITGLGHCRVAAGPLQEAIALMEQAIRLSPRDPRIGIWYYIIGRVHLLQSRIDQAIPWLEKAGRANPQQVLTHAFLASAFALKNENKRAAFELAEAQRLSGDDRYASIARLKAHWSYGVPEIRALYEPTFFAGLRQAGMPEK